MKPQTTQCTYQTMVNLAHLGSFEGWLHHDIYILYTRLIKNILKNERVCRDICENRKSTGTRWLWKQNEIPLPHNNRT